MPRANRSWGVRRCKSSRRLASWCDNAPATEGDTELSDITARPSHVMLQGVLGTQSEFFQAGGTFSHGVTERVVGRDAREGEEPRAPR